MNGKIHIILAFMVVTNFQLLAIERDTTGMVLNANYVADFGRNFSGGIQKGNFYLGQMNLSMEIPTFKNSGFYVQIQNCHGATPSLNLTGDIHPFSNIENGDYTYLYMLWYKQSFGPLSATLGVHDLNSEFHITEFGGFFLNSSFGIQPSACLNMSVSIFPKNTLGFVLKYDVANWLTLQSSVYDGDPGTLEDDPHNTHFSIDLKEQGLYTASEIHIHNTKEEQTSTYKLGYQYHSAKFERFADSTLQQGDWGVYCMADHYINNKMGVFTQLGWTPPNRNRVNFYAGLGLTLFGHGRRENDQFGMALSYILLSPQFAKPITGKSYNAEATLEFSYNFQLNESISIQPDIQYILNPGGMYAHEEALVRMIRTNINF
jgi:porin